MDTGFFKIVPLGGRFAARRWVVGDGLWVMGGGKRATVLDWHTQNPTPTTYNPFHMLNSAKLPVWVIGGGKRATAPDGHTQNPTPTTYNPFHMLNSASWRRPDNS